MELFTFLQMGGALERIDVRRLGDDQNVLRQLARFDASVAQCFKNEDRQRLLGIIESAFGSFVDFNASVSARIKFTRPVAEKRLRESAKT